MLPQQVHHGSAKYLPDTDLFPFIFALKQDNTKYAYLRHKYGNQAEEQDLFAK